MSLTLQILVNQANNDSTNLSVSLFTAFLFIVVAMIFPVFVPSRIMTPRKKKKTERKIREKGKTKHTKNEIAVYCGSLHIAAR